MALVTTHYGKMVWLRYCVRHVGKALRIGDYPIPLCVTTSHRFQGLLGLAILALLHFEVPGMKTDVCKVNTLTNRADSEVHICGRFTK